MPVPDLNFTFVHMLVGGHWAIEALLKESAFIFTIRYMLSN